MASIRRLFFSFLRKLFDDCNPMTLCLILAFFFTVPFILYTSSGEINISLLNSYQDTNTKVDSTFVNGCINTQDYLEDPNYIKQNATFVILTRNKELDQLIGSISSVEEHFNQWFHYPYVFLNDEPFTQEFKDTIKSFTDSNISFGLIEPEDWNIPTDNEITMKESIQLQGDRGILYADMESYHKMCRYYSGKFYQNELVSQYEWYWRLEPSVEFFCDLSYDPFFEMSRANKKYGFTIIIPELYRTIPNLFRTTQSYLKEYNVSVGSLWKLFTTDYHIVNIDDYDEKNQYHNVDSDSEYLNDIINNDFDTVGAINDKIAIDYFLREGYKGNEEGLKKLIERARSKPPLIQDKFEDLEYNLCHFWSNFEIARLDIFQDETYNNYFKYLEANNGFWKERWGDAPVHSLGLSMILDINDIHYFRDIGYRHDTLQHCPKNSLNTFEFPYKETNLQWERTNKNKKAQYDSGFEFGSGCRCKCPTKYKRETEDDHPFCLNKWYDLTHSKEPNSIRTPKYNLTKILKSLEKEFLRSHRIE